MIEPQLRLIGASFLDVLRTARILQEELAPETADRVMKRLIDEEPSWPVQADQD